MKEKLRGFGNSPKYKVLYDKSKGLIPEAVSDAEPEIHEIIGKIAIDIEHGSPVKSKNQGSIPEVVFHPGDPQNPYGEFFIPGPSKGTSAEVDQNMFIPEWFQVNLVEPRKIKPMPVVQNIPFDGSHLVSEKSLVGDPA
jgi:hypothetical protein